MALFGKKKEGLFEDIEKPIKIKIEAYDGERKLFSEEFEIERRGIVKKVDKKRPKSL